MCTVVSPVLLKKNNDNQVEMGAGSPIHTFLLAWAIHLVVLDRQTGYQ